VQPIVDAYLGHLERRLRDLGIDAPLVIMLSNGGLAVPADARAYPVRLVESGPAAGVIAAARLAARLHYKSAMTFDMGGTTAKGSIVHDGFVEIEFESEVARLERFKAGSGLPLTVPTVDLIEIGAGGGSIAHVDTVGRLQVGPRSAESEPGPAAYGLGGTDATVTDADLVLGYLDPASFAGGRFTLDLPAARSALRVLGDRLGVGELEAAFGIHTIVNQNMASAFRIHAIERGVDIRECKVIAFGGAGAIHACAVAEILGARTVTVPFHASVFSALGLTETMPSFSSMRTAQSILRDADYDALNAMFAELERECREKVHLANPRGAAVSVQRALEMRYAGQMRQIQVRVPAGALGPGSEPEIAQAFSGEYRKRFEQIVDGVELEIVNLSVAVRTVAEDRESPAGVRGEVQTTQTHRDVWFDRSAPLSVPVYDWPRCVPNARLAGPALLDRADTVVAIRPGWTAELLADRTLVAVRG
jgi:N-methylhydantoinase A/oxoprolinase/acetone carboxylase beta subunit